MLVILRLVGVGSAAVWLGAAVFFTFGVEAGFLTRDILGQLGPAYAEAAAEVIRQRFFTLEFWCAAIGLAQLLAEWLYSGRPLRRGAVYLAVALWALALFEGAFFQPRLRHLNLDRAGRLSTVAQRERGQRYFPIWHGAFQTVNGLVCLGLLVYVWQVTLPANPPRYLSANKFRG